MTTYTTIQGDMWDEIAKKVYGNEKHMAVLLDANCDHIETVMFSAGTVLTVPDIDTQTTSQGLPPWK